MAKLTLADLKRIRDEKSKEMIRRDTFKEINVVVGMGTCGIASGAKDTFVAFVSELEKEGITNVAVKQTKCMGACAAEPAVKVVVPGMPDTVYGKVNADVVRKIVKEHIIGKKVVSENVA